SAGRCARATPAVARWTCGGWPMSEVPGRRAAGGGEKSDDDEVHTPGAVTSAYERVSGPLGDFARTIEHAPQVLPGSVLTDPRWLARRVADTGRRWNHDD